jgi:hypothetical protein
MKNPEERAADPSGIGGYKCFCCGPRKGDRKPWRRLVRRRMAQAFRRAWRREIAAE